MALTRKEHLIEMISEECNEIGQRASKALRFGLDEIQPGQELNNKERILIEFNDLIGVLELLQSEGVFEEIFNRQLIEKKKEKVEEFLKYSAACGRLKEE